MPTTPKSNRERGGYKQIKLTKGLFALVDAADYKWLSQWKWHALTDSHNSYAARSAKKADGKTGMIMMHRVILNTPKDKVTDHLNHNTLDNRRKNLRICSQKENIWNSRKGKTNTSGVKHVNWNRTYKNWVFQVQRNFKKIIYRRFKTKKEAIEASKLYEQMLRRIEK